MSIGLGTLDKAEFKKLKLLRRAKTAPSRAGPDEQEQSEEGLLDKIRSDVTRISGESLVCLKKEHQEVKKDEKRGHMKANEEVEHRLEGDYLNTDGDQTIVSPKKGISPPESVLDIDKKTPDNWIPRSAEQVRLTGAHPLNSEQSLEVLAREGLITSNAVHYVRNHAAVPKLDWKTHKLKIGGLVDKPKEFSMDELSSMSSINIPVTIACDGNRRKEVNAIRHSKGFDWGSGAISTAYWRGVRLCDVLKAVGVKSTADGAKYVCFDGADQPKNGTYGTR